VIRLIRILVFLVGLCAVAAYVLLYTNTPQARQLEDELRKYALGRLVLPKVPGLPDPYKRVFVTSTSYTGDLGGLAGADLKCQAAAESVGLHGTFKAWLSDKKTPAPSRLSDLGPWYSIDGTRKLFHNRKSFLASPLAPIDLDERGQRVTAGQSVWTGTAPGAWSPTPVATGPARKKSPPGPPERSAKRTKSGPAAVRLATAPRLSCTCTASSSNRGRATTALR
jgi:hypothetical protein